MTTERRARKQFVGSLIESGADTRQVQLIADEVLADQIIETFADGDTTPSVAGDQTFYKTGNTGATTITDLDDGRSGQEVTIVFGDANTTVDFSGSNLIGNGGVDFTAAVNDQIRCLYDGTNWFCDVPTAGGATLNGLWQYDSTITAANPGAGNFRLNNANPSLATSLYINDETKDGIDFSVILASIDPGDLIYIQNGENAQEALLASVTLATDNTGWWTIDFTVSDSNGTSWTDGKEFGFVFVLGSGGGGGSDEFVNGLSFNTTDGVLTATRAIGADLTVDLDGRYAVGQSLPAGTIDRQILVWDEGGSSWGASINLDLPDSGYIRLRNATSEFVQLNLDANDKLRVEGNLETVFDFNMAVAWEDSGAVSDVRLLELTDDPDSIAFGDTIQSYSVNQSTVFQTTSDTFVNVTPMKIGTAEGLVKGRDYVIILSARAANGGGSGTTRGAARMIYSGVEYPGTDFRNESRIGTDTSGINGDHFGTMMVIENYDGSDVQMQVRRLSAAGTMGVNGGQIWAMDLTDFVKGTDWYYNENTTTTALDGTNKTFANITIGDGTKDYMVAYCFQSSGANGSTRDTVSGITDGTTAIDFFWLSSEDTADNQTHVAWDVKENVPLSTTYSVFGREEDGQITDHDVSRIFAIDLSLFGNASWTVAAEPNTITQGSPDNILTHTHTAVGSEEVSILASTVDWCGSVDLTGNHEINYNIDSGADTTWNRGGVFNTGFGLNEIVQSFTPQGLVSLTNTQQLEVKFDRTNESANQQSANGQTSILVLPMARAIEAESFVIGDPGYNNRVDGIVTQVTSELDVRGLFHAHGAGVFYSTLNVNGALTVLGAATLDNNLIVLGDTTAQSVQVLDLDIVNGSNSVLLSIASGTLSIAETSVDKLKIDGFTSGVEIDANVPITAINESASSADLIQRDAAPGDSLYADVKLNCHFDGTNGATTTTDDSDENQSLVFAGNAQISTTRSKFGGSSLSLDGVDDEVNISDVASLELTNQDFSIQAWVNFNAGAVGIGDIFTKYNATFSDRSFIFGFNGSGELRFLWSTNGTTNKSYTSSDAPTLVADQWYYCEVTRSGSNLYLFIDGTLLTASGDSIGTDSLENNTRPFTIGNRDSDGGELNGYIDDLRVTIGSARNTTSYTPPTSPHPNSTSLRDKVVVGDAALGTDLQGTEVTFNDGAGIYTGTGSPESAVTAPVGSLFLRTDGGASTTIYVKESGTGNTGWVAK